MPSFSTCTQKALTPTAWFVCMGSLHDEHGHGFPSYPKIDAVYCCTIVLVDPNQKVILAFKKLKNNNNNNNNYGSIGQLFSRTISLVLHNK